jgi:DNA-binding IclR family transcriptional regulator
MRLPELTAGELLCLKALRESESPMTRAELAKATNLQPGTVSARTSFLAQCGLVKIEGDSYKAVPNVS